MSRRAVHERIEPRLVPPPVAKPPRAAAPEGRINVSWLAAAAAGRRRSDENEQGRLPEINPFVLPKVPRGLVPEGIIVAQDSEMSGPWGWARGDGAWAEGIGFMGYPYLSELSQRAEYRRAVETIAKEMTRKWIRLQVAGEEAEVEETAEAVPGEGPEFEDDGVEIARAERKRKAKKLRELEAAMKAHNLQALFRQVAEHDGYFGRGQIFVDVGETWRKDDTLDDELSKPLGYDKGKIDKGTKLRFSAVEPLWSYPGMFSANDPLRPDFYAPEYWYVMARRVHASRLLTFVGREVPDLLKPAYAFGGLALTQMMKPYVDNWLRTRQSVSDLIHSFSIMVLATDLATQLQQFADGSSLFARADFFTRTRDNSGLMMVDKEKEQFSNVNAPLGTLDALQAQSQEQMAAVTGIPLVVFLGITPKGLNASSEGEIRVFYSWIKAQQEQLFRANLTRALNALQLSLFGEIDPAITFEFVPLMELSEKEAAEVQKTKAETAKTLCDAGIIDPEEDRQRLVDDQESDYNGIDVDDVPEPVEETGGTEEAGGELGLGSSFGGNRGEERQAA